MPFDTRIAGINVGDREMNLYVINMLDFGRQVQVDNRGIVGRLEAVVPTKEGSQPGVVSTGFKKGFNRFAARIDLLLRLYCNTAIKAAL
jgi:hypothetical protein